jgi:hypothetical protein
LKEIYGKLLKESNEECLKKNKENPILSTSDVDEFDEESSWKESIDNSSLGEENKDSTKVVKDLQRTTTYMIRKGNALDAMDDSIEISLSESDSDTDDNQLSQGPKIGPHNMHH